MNQILSKESKNKKFKELSDWVMIGNSATRIRLNGDINNISDRVAFIEKTPRVRVYKCDFYLESEDGAGCKSSNTDAWVYGSNRSSEYGNSQKSREWCDDMLTLLGWE